jgi:hypothetical protein
VGVWGFISLDLQPIYKLPRTVIHDLTKTNHFLTLYIFRSILYTQGDIILLYLNITLPPPPSPPLPQAVAVVAAGALATKGVGRELSLEALNAGPVGCVYGHLWRRI